MKLKSLLLGSATAVGLSTGAFAADLSTVISSFDICEQIGVDYGVAMSTDCVQISGGVAYELNWGDYRGTAPHTNGLIFSGGRRAIDDNDGVAPAELDWRSRTDWWLKFVALAASDFGNAQVVIKIGEDDHIDDEVQNETLVKNDPLTVVLKEAYVAVGDTTKLIAGRRDTSVFLDKDDTPFGFIGLSHSDEVDAGVGVLKNHLPLKGEVIQLYHAVGDSGIVVSAGLENLNTGAVALQAATAWTPAIAALTGVQAAGSAVGTIEYIGDTFAGYISVGAGGILDGTVEDWKIQAAGTATMDNFKVRGAFAGGSTTIAAVTTTEWNGLATGEATFDIFTLAAAFEAANMTQTGGFSLTQWGGSVTASAAVTDSVTLNAGFRWFDSDTAIANTQSWKAAGQLIAKLTETLKATGEVGYYSVGTAIAVGVAAGQVPVNADGAFYGSAELAWAPGGGFTSSVKGEMNSLGAYKATFKAAKTFQ